MGSEGRCQDPSLREAERVLLDVQDRNLFHRSVTLPASPGSSGAAVRFLCIVHAGHPEDGSDLRAKETCDKQEKPPPSGSCSGSGSGDGSAPSS